MAVDIRRYSIKCGLWAVVFLLMSLGICQGASAAESEEDASRAILDYAQFLYDEGDMSRAAGEAKRFLFFHPRHSEASLARDLLVRIQKKSADRPGFQTTGSPIRGVAVIKDENSAGLWGNAAIGLIHFYQEHLRTFKNPQSACPSYPECSTYTIQAVKKHGALLGTFMLIDRLWRETGTAGEPPFVRHQGRVLHYDPLEWNDYWLGVQKETP